MAGKTLKKPLKPRDFLPPDPWAKQVKAPPLTKEQRILDLRDQFRLLGRVQEIKNRSKEQ